MAQPAIVINSSKPAEIGPDNQIFHLTDWKLFETKPAVSMSTGPLSTRPVLETIGSTDIHGYFGFNNVDRYAADTGSSWKCDTKDLGSSLDGAVIRCLLNVGLGGKTFAGFGVEELQYTRVGTSGGCEITFKMVKIATDGTETSLGEYVFDTSSGAWNGSTITTSYHTFLVDTADAVLATGDKLAFTAEVTNLLGNTHDASNYSRLEIREHAGKSVFNIYTK